MRKPLRQVSQMEKCIEQAVLMQKMSKGVEHAGALEIGQLLSRGRLASFSLDLASGLCLARFSLQHQPSITSHNLREPCILHLPSVRVY